MATIRRRRKADGTVVWDAMVRLSGFPRTGRTCATKAEAQKWAAETEAAGRGRTLGAGGKLTFAALLDEELPRLRNPVTAAFEYRRAALGHLRLDRISPDVIARHRDLLLGAPCSGHNHKTTRPRSEATVRNYLLELSRLFTVAVRDRRLIQVNPCEQITKPGQSRQIVRWLADDEREVLLRECRASASPDLYPFVLFCLTTGCRKGEAAALLWRNVDLRRRWATFETTKNGDPRGVPLTAAVAQILAGRPRDADLVFTVDVTKAWHTAIARAGIENFRFHDLRHSCASALVQHGANLAEVGKLLGHKSPAMTYR